VPTVDCACAATVALMAATIAVMASNRFRMVCSFAMRTRTGVCRHATDPIHRARHRSRKKAQHAAAHFGQFLNAAGNRLWCKASPVVEQGAAGGGKVALLESMSQSPAEMPL
jgi:hypothetical protein